jgi:hypothetical protein
VDEDQVTQNAAENEQVAEDSNVDTSPVVEEQTSDSPETDQETPSAEESPVETESEPERKPTRAERRIRDLVNENKRLKEQSNQPFQGFQQPPTLPVIEPGQELTEEQYQQHVVQAADAIAGLRTQQQLDQFKAEANLDRDVEVLPKQYPELDETSSEYNPVLVEKVEAAFKSRAFQNGQLNPNVRLADVAKDFVDVARAAAKKSTADLKNAVARSADETSIRPTSERREETPFDSLSEKEMEARLGFAE